MIDILQQGSDALVVADTNKEVQNLLSLPDPLPARSDYPLHGRPGRSDH